MFDFYVDPALTRPATRMLIMAMIGAGGGSSMLYFGSRNAAVTLLPVGTSNIYISAEIPPGAAVSASDVKLAMSRDELATAIAGAPLSVGPSLAGGATEAVEVWVSVTPSSAGRMRDAFQLLTSTVAEMAS